MLLGCWEGRPMLNSGCGGVPTPEDCSDYAPTPELVRIAVAHPSLASSCLH